MTHSSFQEIAMSYMKRHLEDVMTDMESETLNEHVVAEAARRIGEQNLLKYKEIRVVMCDRCTNTLIVKGRHGDSLHGLKVDGIGIPTKCSCGGEYIILDPNVAKLKDLLTDGAELKREDQLEVGDVVEPLTHGLYSGWSRQVVLEVDHEQRRIRYARAYITGFFHGTGPEPYPKCEDYLAHWSEHELGWVKCWRDSSTVYHYLQDRRSSANKEQLTIYWERLHFAIERECTEPAENEHQLRYDCMVIEHDVIRAGVPIPEIPTKDQIEAGTVI
jgi:hypothetical protein